MDNTMFAPGGPESQVKAFVEDESGVGVVEIILILVVIDTIQQLIILC